MSSPRRNCRRLSDGAPPVRLGGEGTTSWRWKQPESFSRKRHRPIPRGKGDDGMPTWETRQDLPTMRATLPRFGIDVYLQVVPDFVGPVDRIGVLRTATGPRLIGA